MTVKELLDQVKALRANTFSDDQLMTWLNEVEGHIQTEVFLAPIEVCFEHRLAATITGAAVSFPDRQTMLLREDLGFAPCGTVTISGLTGYASNNGGPYTVQAVSDDGLTVVFKDNTFAQTGDTADTGTLVWNGNGVKLLALPPHDKLYRPYLLAQIAFAQEEWDGYQNYMAMYNEFMHEYKIWFAREYRPADRRRRYWRGNWIL